MSGKYGDQSSRHSSRPMYHRKRRGAQDFTHVDRDEDSDQRSTAQSSGFDYRRIDKRDGGGGGGLIRKRAPGYGTKSITRTFVNKIIDEDVSMKKDQTSDHRENRTNGSKYGYAVNTLGSIVRVKQSKAPRLAIGESNEEKTLLSVKPYSKLSTMDQSLFDIIVQFSQQYFTCFDKSRDELLAAYHPNALYSVSLILKSNATVKGAKFDDCFFRDSRNLLFVEGAEKKFRMLRRGNFDIVAFIKKMPLTEHDSDSLKLDCGFFQSNMITFSISGVFREGKPENAIRPFRNFQRTFICIPAANNKMVIVNEQFMISNLTETQANHYKEEIAKMQMTTDELPQQQQQQQQLQKEGSKISTSVPTFSTSTNEEQMKSLMIEEFSRLSGLNKKWSQDVLEHSKWDMNAAQKNFIEHKKNIPQDAYIVSFK